MRKIKEKRTANSDFSEFYFTGLMPRFQCFVYAYVKKNVWLLVVFYFSPLDATTIETILFYF